MQEKSEQDKFVVGNIASDLMDKVIVLCAKDQRKTTKFPKVLYQSYVNAMVNTALSIHKDVCLANASRDKTVRFEHQNSAQAKLLHLMSLMDIALNHKWISDKQNDSFQKLANNLYWKIYNWKRSN